MSAGRSPRRESCLLNCLRTAGNRIVLHAELRTALYGDDPDGGALWARSALAVYICNLRKAGFPIENAHGRGYQWGGQTAIPLGDSAYDPRMSVRRLLFGPDPQHLSHGSAE